MNDGHANSETRSVKCLVRQCMQRIDKGVGKIFHKTAGAGNEKICEELIVLQEVHFGIKIFKRFSVKLKNLLNSLKYILTYPCRGHECNFYRFFNGTLRCFFYFGTVNSYFLNETFDLHYRMGLFPTRSLVY